MVILGTGLNTEEKSNEQFVEIRRNLKVFEPSLLISDFGLILGCVRAFGIGINVQAPGH